MVRLIIGLHSCNIIFFVSHVMIIHPQTFFPLFSRITSLSRSSFMCTPILMIRSTYYRLGEAEGYTLAKLTSYTTTVLILIHVIIFLQAYDINKSIHLPLVVYPIKNLVCSKLEKTGRLFQVCIHL